MKMMRSLLFKTKKKPSKIKTTFLLTSLILVKIRKLLTHHPVKTKTTRINQAAPLPLTRHSRILPIHLKTIFLTVNRCHRFRNWMFKLMITILSNTIKTPPLRTRRKMTKNNWAPTPKTWAREERTKARSIIFRFTNLMKKHKRPSKTLWRRKETTNNSKRMLFSVSLCRHQRLNRWLRLTSQRLRWRRKVSWAILTHLKWCL